MWQTEQKDNKCAETDGKDLADSALPLQRSHSESDQLLCRGRWVTHLLPPQEPRRSVTEQKEKQLSAYLCLWGKCSSPLSFFVLLSNHRPPPPGAQPPLSRSHLAVRQLMFELMGCYIMSHGWSSIAVDGNASPPLGSVALLLFAWLSSHHTNQLSDLRLEEEKKRRDPHTVSCCFTFYHLPALYLQDAGSWLVMIFLCLQAPPLNLASSFTLLHSRWWLLSVYGYSWPPVHISSLWTVHGLGRVGHLALFYLSAPSACDYHLLAVLFCLFLQLRKIPHRIVNQSAFTSRAHPCGVVSIMVPVRPALDVAAFWLLSHRLCWEDSIQPGMIGNMNSFVREMWKWEGKCGW